MGKIKELSLMKCLSDCGVRELPEEDKGELVWVKAIGLVAKRDTTHSYVSLVRGEDGEPRIVKDFGTISSIVGIESIHPYEYLSSRFMPKFKNDTRKDERVAWLSAYEPSIDWGEMTIKELDKAVLNRAVRNQLNLNRNR